MSNPILRWTEAGLAALLLSACGSAPPPAVETTKTMPIQAFGTAPSGGSVEIHTLKNAKGVEARIATYGGTVVSLKVPDRTGKMDDIVLGFDSLDGYLKDHPYFGATIGRYGNRIAKGKFTLSGVVYTLAKNNGENALHGGPQGFHRKVWKATPHDQSVELTYVSKDGEEGYPGTLSSTVTYTLTDANELRIDYMASTDKDTVVNLTNHSYFNLAGQGVGDILGHQVEILADTFTPVDAGLIPTGEMRSVEKTPFDFRQTHTIGERINDSDEQLKLGKGYDHNFVLRQWGDPPRLAARVTEPKSGRVMEVLTTEPGLQFYTGNFLDGSLVGKGGKKYEFRYGFCMETQHFPDSPNQPKFPTTVLKPGARYQATTIYRFTTL